MYKRVHSSLRYLTPAEFETHYISVTLDSRLPS
jgi:transposase InsO family protein